MRYNFNHWIYGGHYQPMIRINIWIDKLIDWWERRLRARVLASNDTNVYKLHLLISFGTMTPDDIKRWQKYNYFKP